MKSMELIDRLTNEGKLEWDTPVFFDTTETMRTNNADLNKLQEETFVAIVTGSKPVDEFDAFVDAWSSRGGEQITKEVQEIIDAQ